MWIFAGGAVHGKCRACHAEIVWVFTERGARAPINAPLRLLDHKPLDVATPNGIEQLTLSRIDPAQSHFATCPCAERFRKGKGKPAQQDLWSE